MFLLEIVSHYNKYICIFTILGIKGHLICSSCFQKLKPATCPTCRSDLSQERNLAVEKIAYLLKYPCRYSLSGCKQFFLLPQKDFHERNCQYLLVKCPFMIKNGKCKYNGTLKNTEDHLKTDHKITGDNTYKYAFFNHYFFSVIC